MTDWNAIGIVLALVIPLGAMGGIWLFHGRPEQRERVTLVAAGLLLLVVLSLLPSVLAGLRPEWVFAELFPGIAIAFRVEPLGMLFALVAALLWPINSVYSIGYMRGNNEPHQTRFYGYFALALFATMGIAFAANLVTLFVFYELLTLSTYPLVTHKGNDAARAAGRVYLGILITTSIGLLLPAILWVWSLTGTTDFTVGGLVGDKLQGPWLGLLLFLFMFGIGKAALMPIHRWLPAAMVAPTPVSALLHAVAVVKAGVFSVVKVIVYVFGVDSLHAVPAASWLLYVAGFTIIVASLIALRQDNLKRRLAYSTISQLSYVVLGAAILAPVSIIGAALHIVAHAFGKITLFFAAGSIYTAAHKTEISQLRGIGWRMPWTMTAFSIGALSMIGVPPAAGFISKWYMLLGAFETQQLFAVGVIVLSTVLNAAYFLPIIFTAFARPAEDDPAQHGEAPRPIVIALACTAGLTVLFFLFHQVPLDLAGQLVELPLSDDFQPNGSQPYVPPSNIPQALP
ncbi:monovalent cation/H+ antiporter subunit D family protein [Thiohalocapsa marina]|uniref:Monovalent cation/H+ antiporter subunit D family protein n=1 Tax=Thiohalocapsa marina TaxID=424902 RepID=A0A5M8FV74_9GAMM|nr:monovalent cation/H+ antiporter subunit D family protein [Thiohalocapsa marina]KAA6187685.1 monovalent cation/H+ antiporter subunit D family protein [Thiohalocapsa marina]